MGETLYTVIIGPIGRNIGDSKMKATSVDTVPVINARDSFAKFFEGMMQRKELIFLKLCTNGYPTENSLPSVLAVAMAKYALKSKTKIEPINLFERFYFPTEEFNARAIATNGLNAEAIAAKRFGQNYPERFDEDEEALREYCYDTHLFVGHNIDHFEAEFLPWLHEPGNRTFDVMVENANILRLEHESGCYSGEWKWPKLQELSDYYAISFPDQSPISGMEHVQLIASIFQEMLSQSRLQRIVISS
jgi:DNA polymerase III epsilon subunit-like protein